MKPWAANPPSPIDPGGDPSPLRTSWRSSTSTTGAAVTATRVPSCDEKACTRATWSSGDGPGTRGHSPDWRPRSAPAADHPLRWSWHGPGDEPIEPRPSWPRRGWSSRSREKHRTLGAAAGRERRGPQAAAVIEDTFRAVAEVSCSVPNRPVKTSTSWVCRQSKRCGLTMKQPHVWGGLDSQRHRSVSEHHFRAISPSAIMDGWRRHRPYPHVGLPCHGG